MYRLFWHFSDILTTFMSFSPPLLILFGESCEHLATPVFVLSSLSVWLCAHWDGLSSSSKQIYRWVQLTLNLDLENENPTGECNYRITTNHALTPPLCVIHAKNKGVLVCHDRLRQPAKSPHHLLPSSPWQLCLAGSARGRIIERRFHRR